MIKATASGLQLCPGFAFLQILGSTLLTPLSTLLTEVTGGDSGIAISVKTCRNVPPEYAMHCQKWPPPILKSVFTCTSNLICCVHVYWNQREVIFSTGSACQPGDQLETTWLKPQVIPFHAEWGSSEQKTCLLHTSSDFYCKLWKLKANDLPLQELFPLYIHCVMMDFLLIT